MARLWFSKKTTVEECLTLRVKQLKAGDRLRPTTSIVEWHRGKEEIAHVAYSLRDMGFKEGEPFYILTLHPPLVNEGQRIPITQNISFLTTQLPLGGKRYWFECGDCKRRVGRLHLPSGMNYFLCRKCYDLTYTSCQESHKFDWFFVQIGVPPWVGRRLLNRKV